MASARIVNRLVLRCFLILTSLLIFFNEFLIYHINQLSWQKIDCQHANCTRILFIADPQLLGKTFDKSLYSPFAIYDSDRYLKKTFQNAVEFTKPHIICFLGDLLDEGSVASPELFQSYVDRFQDIYHTKENIRHVHIPGDNDIGGENGEYISNLNVKRFKEHFMANDIFDYKSRIRFFKINRMLLDFTNPDKEHNKNRLRIGLSHGPILIGGGPLLRSIISEINPHIMFSAHWHESRIFVYPSTKAINFYETSIKKFDLESIKEEEHSYLEIMVPTSSYRMGKIKIGIGYAVFDNYDLRYTVLWLPQRFIYLLMYVYWLIFALCGQIIYKMMTRCPFRVAKRQQTQYSNISVVPQF